MHVTKLIDMIVADESVRLRKHAGFLLHCNFMGNAT